MNNQKRRTKLRSQLLTALNDAGGQAGTLIVTDPVRTKIITGSVGGTRSYIEHTISIVASDTESRALDALPEAGVSQMRVVRAKPDGNRSDRIVSFFIQLEAPGNAHALGFRLNFDPNRSTRPLPEQRNLVPLALHFRRRLECAHSKP
jgi:hypothetical protein